MGKFGQLSPELWPLIGVFLFNYIELIFVAGYHACLQRFYFKMNHVARKHVVMVSDQVRHKPDCTTTEGGWRLEISDSHIFKRKADFLMTRLK